MRIFLKMYLQSVLLLLLLIVSLPTLHLPVVLID